MHNLYKLPVIWGKQQSEHQQEMEIKQDLIDVRMVTLTVGSVQVN